jgi:plasmid stabilization system protein ParE
MAYRVELARRAEADLEELYLWVIDRAPQQGARWFNGLERAVLSLDQHPKRCPVASESFDPDRPVRVLTYGRKPHAYRIFFTVDDDAEIVHVLHVRRSARRRPIPDELKGDRLDLPRRSTMLFSRQRRR